MALHLSQYRQPVLLLRQIILHLAKPNSSLCPPLASSALLTNQTTFIWERPTHRQTDTQRETYNEAQVFPLWKKKTVPSFNRRTKEMA